MDLVGPPTLFSSKIQSSSTLMNKYPLNKRMLSLDVFRGLTIMLMILVNSPGNQTAYKILEHSKWNGCTLADLVFPFFLFIVGVSLVFSLIQSSSFPRRRESMASIQSHFSNIARKNELLIKILKRSLIILFLGILLNGFPFYDLSTLRFPGVLQRIAICYFFAALLFLTTRIRTQIFLFFVTLIGYAVLMDFIPELESGIPYSAENNNWAAYIDRLFFTGHMYKPFSDPEGILSTFPALATTLLGVFTGVWLRSENSSNQKLGWIIGTGTACLIVGWIWGLWFPINKSLWTSSFVLWTGGLALYLLAFIYWLIEIKNWRAWSKPFEIFGLNAIAVYLLHIIFLRIQNYIHLPKLDGSPGNLRFYLTEHLFGLASLPNASLLYAISYILFWLFILWILYRNKIFIKI